MADDLTVAIYEGTQSFPKEELYGLTSQLRRAAYSVPANIAEGACRRTKKDYLHFLHISAGSLSVAHYFIHLSERLRYLPTESAQKLQVQARQAFACLNGLIGAVEKEAAIGP